MNDGFSRVRTVVIQAAPILFEREATVVKTCDLITQAGKMGANLILFPEVFIPAYPLTVYGLPITDTRVD